MARIRKVVIPAAGSGKRFYPLSRAQPKEMLPILDKPVIHYVVEEAVKSGLDEILIIVGHGKDSIINYFDRHGLDDTMDTYGFKDLPDIYFVRQKEQKGLADAIKYSKKFVGDEDFVVLLGDTIYVSNNKETVTSKFVELSSRTGSPSIAVEKVPEERLSQYGVISYETLDRDLYLVKDIVEKPERGSAPSNMGITGIYVLDPSIFQFIEMIEPGKDGEYQLSDALRAMAKEKKFLASTIDGVRYDIGNKDLWFAAFNEFFEKYWKKK